MATENEPFIDGLHCFTGLPIKILIFNSKTVGLPEGMEVS